jgi:hypothetical protein
MHFLGQNNREHGALDGIGVDLDAAVEKTGQPVQAIEP